MPTSHLAWSSHSRNALGELEGAATCTANGHLHVAFRLPHDNRNRLHPGDKTNPTRAR
jgi:hypothetical protein